VSGKHRESQRIRYRSRPRASDRVALRGVVASTRMFNRAERATALEVLDERLQRGPKSGYSFFFAERDRELVGYCSYGPVPLTKRSYDLYWIVVSPSARRLGIGRALMALVERAVARCGGGGLYVETSSRRAYDRTRRFYRLAGYRQVARFAAFYAPRDAKVVFCKVISAKRRD
jgi:ribosomal protein S18 acetylase RimI-like enzyme